ncbi:hypothetical protein GALLN_00030 [Gallionellaceae bacterium]|nr:hypothetical protein GALLN_00030 [Gallionellaceae bacterium]
MKSYARHVLTHLLILLLSVSVALTLQNSASAQSIHAFNQEELDQMLAPIALYPDALLSQILMASTYPLEIGEAAHWSRANPDLKGEQAVKAVDKKNWDPSVKSLVAFPQILLMMDEKLDWTERLGDAFLAQQSQVMDTVQYLRQRAQEAGNLYSSDQIRVVPQEEVIVIESVNPRVIYVPYYDPVAVYGPWWWPAYPPVYWAPWPGYYFVDRFAWDVGIMIGTEFFFGAIDWPRRHVYVTRFNMMKAHRRPRERHPGAALNVWQHDAEHRRGVPYRETIMRRQSSPANTLPEAQRDFRGYDRSQMEGHGSQQFKDGVPAARPDATGTPIRPSAPGAISRPSVGQPHVFEGVDHGAKVRDFSRRGKASSQGTVPDSRKMAPGPSRARESRSSGNVSAPQSSGGSAQPRSERMREQGGKKPRAADK